MLLWIGFAVLAAGVLAVVLRPLWSAAEVGGGGDPAAVYRDQLDEIAADHERGLIDAGEAEAARTEIARRLLAVTGVDRAAEPSAGEPAAGPAGLATPASQESGSARAPGVLVPARLAAVLGVAMPAAAMAVYLSVGTPGAPDQPLAARMRAPLDTTDVARLVDAVEKRLAQHPEDGQGWEVIAPVYLRHGAYQKAADAYANAIRLLGETPRRLAGFAEATVLVSEGAVTEPARAAWEKLARLEPSRPEPRFWLAIAKEQAGRLDEAAADFKALLAEAPAGTPWSGLVAERIAGIEARIGGNGAGGSSPPGPAEAHVAARAEAPRGPSEADVAAAEKLSTADRQRMIEGMVESLADRLRSNGQDLPGWQRLIRAYAVLGRRQAALDALRTARGHFTAEPASLAALADLARSLGLET